MSTPSGEQVVFRGSLARRALGALVLSAILGALALFALPSFLPVTTSRSTRATLAITAAVIVVALVWGSALWYANTRVIVDRDAVEIRRPGQLLHRWERSNAAFTSRITKRYTNGIPSGVDRTLIVESPGRRDEVNVPLSREAFTELVALLSPLTEHIAVREADGIHTAASLVGTRSFSPDATAVRRSARRAGVAAAVVVAIAAVTIAVAMSGVLVRDDREIVSVVVVPLLLVLAVILGVVALVTAARARSVPGRVDVSAGAVTVDGQTFFLAQQRAVRLSPPAYPRRRLVVVDPTGTTRRWLLGLPGSSKRTPEILPAYPDLVAAVAAAAVGAEQIVRLDLE
ncbi:hypothetical protein E5344_10045 [Microbacterium laevaniformans]|uniref:Uncharacterized protein n=1 Tax=Microbacterium laevaniformans TaxID=36807 RepID=A0A4V3RJJ1_9MICO|nr:hypothetical protein [Microbacterium laevaniformans]TGY36120.1 hypothetical protein E5344_10045 [Microbacterium laevaniformans]